MTALGYTNVTLVVDPDFGPEARAQAQLGPLWVIRSPRNEPVINDLWAGGQSRFADSPTLFDHVPGRSPEDAAIEFIGNLNEHHPEWQTLEIIGVRQSPKLLAALRECAAGLSRKTRRGFIFVRAANLQ
jgi:hypothetical protein